MCGADGNGVAWHGSLNAGVPEGHHTRCELQIGVRSELMFAGSVGEEVGLIREKPFGGEAKFFVDAADSCPDGGGCFTGS